MTTHMAATRIDVRLACRVYAWIALPAGLYVYFWPLLVERFSLDIQGMPWGRFAVVRIAAATIAAAGIFAIALTKIRDPADARWSLRYFALAHLVFGVMFYIQWHAILEPAIPPLVGWAPLIAGAVLTYVAETADGATPMRRLWTGGLFTADERGPENLRPQYEEQLLKAARQEERARLARDLHDAVKQQLFVIQTSAATAEARFDADAAGARAALERVRAATREGIVEMQALIEELQAAPLENVGLVEALKKQCEALGFRTGADVKLEIGQLPKSQALRPGTQEALFRAAQEALANTARHARAKHVTVTLGVTGNQLRLYVHDDGAGFDAEQAPRGMGLRNLAERAREIGGSFTLDTRPGRGTSILISVPYEAVTAAEYGHKALGWAAVAAIFGATDVYWAPDRPWYLVYTLIVGIITARYAAAYFRLRGRQS